MYTFICASISWNKGHLGSITLRRNDSTRLKFKWAKLSNHCNRSVFNAKFIDENLSHMACTKVYKIHYITCELNDYCYNN